MRWIRDPDSGSEAKIGWSYRIARRFYRFLTNIWFREVNIVDDENLPQEGGMLFVTWHPSGLIDPMLMTSVLPGRLTTVAKHTLFKIPLLGRLLKASGVVPIERPQDSSDKEGARHRNAEQLSELSKRLAHGGRVLIFPEGVTHAGSEVRTVRSGAARMLLAARREASLNGLPEPHLIPIGLHYSESQRFRERAAVVIERSMAAPPLPETTHDEEEQDRRDRAWVDDVTEDIRVELQRVNLSRTSWRERTMIWKGRSLVYAEKQRLAGDQLVKPSYAESVLGARRLRAGWEYMLQTRPDDTHELVSEFESHFANLDHRAITPYDVDARPEQLTFLGNAKAFLIWLWALVWMFGLVTWSAFAGNYVPYKLNGLLSWFLKRRSLDSSVVGTIKVLSAIVFFPIWWMAASALMTWSLLDPSSPVNGLLISHWLLLRITYLPSILVFSIFLFWWPTSAKLNLKLYARLVRGSRDLKRWALWKDESTDWDELVSTQRRLATILVQSGAELVLPGDDDWQDPPSGQDDVTVVRPRENAAS
jgi:1-acyl-sn-glycerol-3-phosphate acyltransferase